MSEPKNDRRVRCLVRFGGIACHARATVGAPFGRELGAVPAANKGLAQGAAVHFFTRGNGPAYQKILAMGQPAVKLIFKQLENEGDDPDHWFWALEYLTGENPVRPENKGDMKRMRGDWLRWGLANGKSW